MSQTIYSSQVEKPIFGSPSEPIRCEFLKKSEFLGEFKTEAEKARARFNLGLPDDYALNWGNIRGNIQNQTDLMQLLSDINQNVKTKLQSQDYILASVQKKIVELDQSVTVGDKVIKLTDLYYRLLELRDDVTKNTVAISNLAGGAYPGGGNTGGGVSEAVIESLRSEINSLSTQIITLNSRLAVAESDINRLNASLSGDILSELRVSRSSINTTNQGDDIPITVTAIFTKSGERDVTELCSVTSSKQNIARWDRESLKIKLAENILTSDTVILSFTYMDKTIDVELNITVEGQAQYKQYVGWAQDYEQILGNNTFSCDTVAKKWTDAPKIGTQAPYYFFIITTQNIQNILSAVGAYDMNKLYDRSITYNGTTYNIYKVGPSRDTNAEITIQI